MTLFSDILSIPSNPEDIFTLLNPIGHGAFGYVYKAIHNQSKKIYAVKIINYFKDNINFLENKKHIDNINFCYQTVQQETSLMKKVCSSNYILKYYGSYFSRKTNTLWLIIEYCSYGSTIDLILAMNRMYTEVEVATIIKMVLQGLIIIHEKNLIHRDIKGANILLSEDGYVKLGDFGVGTKLEQDFRKSIKGSPYWMSPQVVQKEYYDNKTDIWSLGITCIELLQGVPPNSELSPNEVMEKIGNKNFNFDDFFGGKKSKYSTEYINFISRCLQINPEKRSSAKELIKHKFISKYAKDNFFLKELLQSHEKDMENYRKEFEKDESNLKLGNDYHNNIFLNNNDTQILNSDININESFFKLININNEDNIKENLVTEKKINHNLLINEISPVNSNKKIIYKKISINRKKTKSNEKNMNYSSKTSKNKRKINLTCNNSINRNHSFIILPKEKNKINKSRNKIFEQENFFYPKNESKNYTNTKCQVINFGISMKKTLSKEFMTKSVYNKKIIIDQGKQRKSYDKKYNKLNSNKKIKTINSNINTEMNTNNTNSINIGNYSQINNNDTFSINSFYDTKNKFNLKMKLPIKTNTRIFNIPNLNIEKILNNNRNKLNLFKESESEEDIKESNDTDYLMNTINNYTINKGINYDKENRNILNYIRENNNMDTINSYSVLDSKDSVISIHSSNKNFNEPHKKYY